MHIYVIEENCKPILYRVEACFGSASIIRTTVDNGDVSDTLGTTGQCGRYVRGVNDKHLGCVTIAHKSAMSILSR